jgi:pimeloyl-ACP methyl ester carboxylesterase
MLLWGDTDAVAPMEIPKYLAQNVIPPKVVRGVTLQNTGHFLMLERPGDWARLVLEFIGRSKDPYVEKVI